jgi:hypothetical protein
MGLDTKTYWLTNGQSQSDFDFDFDQSSVLVFESVWVFKWQWKSSRCKTATESSSYEDLGCDWKTLIVCNTCSDL